MEISPQYRFDTFAEVESSSLAFAAANAVAEGNDSLGNPLVFVGETGLGKTHLLHSIANASKAKNPNLRIISTTALEFYQEYVKNLRLKNENPELIDNMSSKFRNADMLILDDLQNIRNKTESQHELLQIFNSLLLAGKPIIVASQLPIANIDNLNESLRSRLVGGLSVKFSVPKFVDRLAILRKKCAAHLNIDENILLFLAERTSGTVRDLEGIVSGLKLRVDQKNKNVDLEMANEILEEHFSNSHRTPTMEKIANAVATSYGISLDILRQKGRGSKEVALTRQVAMYLMRDILKKSFDYIGKYFNRDNSTVIYACKSIAEKMQSEIPFRLEVERVRKELYG
ncbi:MAG: ATP-binding protein [Fibromonadaceae bacterium]|jgi:chromosomal replication initiator protein|nr:ATP-binding protein [Fibromonadaceae bacterium]